MHERQKNRHEYDIIFKMCSTDGDDDDEMTQISCIFEVCLCVIIRFFDHIPTP